MTKNRDQRVQGNAKKASVKIEKLPGASSESSVMLTRSEKTFVLFAILNYSHFYVLEYCTCFVSKCGMFFLENTNANVNKYLAGLNKEEKLFDEVQHVEAQRFVNKLNVMILLRLVFVLNSTFFCYFKFSSHIRVLYT